MTEATSLIIRAFTTTGALISKRFFCWAIQAKNLKKLLKTKKTKADDLEKEISASAEFSFIFARLMHKFCPL
jgi:hypothetical protein